MNEEEQVVEIWNLFKPYIDKKQLNLTAEKYIDYLVDAGTHDEVLQASLGHSQSLDNAIHYYLDMEEDLKDDDDITEYED
jgi:hypothetical protein